MKWSPEQDAALLAVDKWLKDPSQQVFRLFGYAGTGKTTIAKEFAEGVDGTVLFGAYTGKAAHVLQTKGCSGARTIHSMIYNSRDQSAARLKELELDLMRLKQEILAETAPDDRADIKWELYPDVVKAEAMIDGERQNCARPIFQLNYESEVKYAKLVVIDEVSMVDGQMAEDLLFFGTKVLVLGDPAQLPPVMGAGYFIKDPPQFMLQEIHRQARDNPIIAMASEVRQGNSLSLGRYGSSEVIGIGDINKEKVVAADQLLVGRNMTRRDYNRRMRQIKHGDSYSWVPVPGDKLVCLRNNHEHGLLNGAQWKANTVLAADENRVTMEVESLDNGVRLDLEVHSHHMLGKTEALPWWERKEAEEFDYGYAMTTHKAQGSQWNDVTVFDESFCFREDRHKWLYTAITRAAQRVTVVKM
jgi:exodeoxyribonuclease-5